MGGGVGENMTEANLYAVLTILAFIAIVPISLAIESPAMIGATISKALAAGFTPGYLWIRSGGKPVTNALRKSVLLAGASLVVPAAIPRLSRR